MDAFAGRGASIALDAFPNDVVKKRYSQAKAWYAWLNTFIENWPEERDFKIRTRDEICQEPPPKKAKRLHDEAPHKIWQTGAGGSA